MDSLAFAILIVGVAWAFVWFIVQYNKVQADFIKECPKQKIEEIIDEIFKEQNLESRIDKILKQMKKND